MAGNISTPTAGIGGSATVTPVMPAVDPLPPIMIGRFRASNSIASLTWQLPTRFRLRSNRQGKSAIPLDRSRGRATGGQGLVRHQVLTLLEADCRPRIYAQG